MINTPTEIQPPKLLEQVAGKLRVKHYSLRTEKSYLNWIKRYILHNGKRHPKEMGAAEVEKFLTYLAVVCALWRRCGYGLKMWILYAVKFWCVRVKGSKIE